MGTLKDTDKLHADAKRNRTNVATIGVKSSSYKDDVNFKPIIRF